GLNNRRAYLHRRLSAAVDLSADPLTIELIAGELFHNTVADTAPIGRLYRPSQLDWYARRVDAARQTLEHDYAGEHSLAALARRAAMSPFHFARVFRDLTGVPPHRYLVKIRLTAAAARLREGASVTDTCFAVGFR